MGIRTARSGLTLSLLALLPSMAMADTNVGLHYTDFGDAFGDGVTLSAAMRPTDFLALRADYSFLESDAVETDILRFGGDYIFPLSEELRLMTGGSLQYWNVEVPGVFGGSHDDIALTVGAALAYQFSDALHLDARGEYLTFLDDDVTDFVISFGGGYRFNPRFSLSGRMELYTGDIDETRGQLGVHIHF